MTESEREICANISRACYHIHPKIVEKIQVGNRRDMPYFKTLFAGRIDISHYLYPDSACVFPGVRRYIGKERELIKKRNYYQPGRAIIEDNEFPRHIWCFLEIGKPYNGPNWKDSGLSDYELAHVFSHKPNETVFERGFFREFREEINPFGNFTCACNTVLVPKGMARPTDNLPTVKAAFYRRYVELYGEHPLNGRVGFNQSRVPEWYDNLIWNEPHLPLQWEAQINKLMDYRKNTISRLLSKS